MVARSPDGGIHCASAGRLCRPRANPPFASDSRFSGAPAAAYVVFEPVSKPPASSVPGDGEADAGSRSRPQGISRHATTARSQRPRFLGVLFASPIAAAFVLMLFSYGLSYRRRFAGILEGGPRPSSQRVLRLASAFLDCFSYRESGFQRSEE